MLTVHYSIRVIDKQLQADYSLVDLLHYSVAELLRNMMRMIFLVVFVVAVKLGERLVSVAAVDKLKILNRRSYLDLKLTKHTKLFLLAVPIMVKLLGRLSKLSSKSKVRWTRTS